MQRYQQRRMKLAVIVAAAAAGALAQECAESSRRIVVSVPDRKLALMEDGRVVKVYSIAVGAVSTPSPTGEFQIVHRIVKPTYYAPGIVIRPGKANPLGTRWLGLSRKGYGIHGTNSPRSIGQRASHGCIRMRNRDVEELFQLVEIGDVVEIHGEADEAVTAIFGTAEPAEVAAGGG